MAHGDFKLCCSEKGPVIAYTRSYQGETWMAVHNFSKETQEFAYKEANVKLQPDTPVIISNYEESTITFHGEVLSLKPYETVVFQLRSC